MAPDHPPEEDEEPSVQAWLIICAVTLFYLIGIIFVILGNLRIIHF